MIEIKYEIDTVVDGKSWEIKIRHYKDNVLTSYQTVVALRDGDDIEFEGVLDNIQMTYLSSILW